MLYCQVYHYIYPPVELESTDEPIEGTIIFTPDIRRGEVWIENNTVVPAVPIRCDVVNGVMRFGGRDGSRFAKLMAGGPGVNPEKVHWRVSFHDMHMGEDYFKINPFIFEAVPNTTINLAEVTPVSGYTPEGIIQGPKGEPGGAATTFYGDEDPIDPLEGDTWFIPGKNGLPDEIRLYMGGEWVTIVSEEYWKIVDEKLTQSEFDLTDPEGKLAKARAEANAALDELDGRLAEASQAISDAKFDINDPEGKLAKASEKAQTDLQTLDQKLYGDNGSLTLLSEKAQDAWNKAVAAGDANVVDVVYEYQQSDSDTVVPTGVWTLDPPTKDSTKFLWRRDTLKYGNGDIEIRPPYPITGPKGERGAVGATGSQGLQGLQGPKGDQGIKGPSGEDGVSSYTHIAYADTSTGGGFSQNPDGKEYMGVYVDDAPEDSPTPSKYHWSLIKGADGAKGVAGAKGADGRTPYFHTAWANNITGTSGFSTTDSIGKTHIGTYTDYVEDDSTTPSKYNWILVKGEKGEPGSSGTDGVGVSKTVINYQLGTSATTAPTGAWYTNVPSAKAGDYVWTRVVWTYTDGTSKTSYSVAMLGEKGEQGSKGDTGAKGATGATGPQGATGAKGDKGATGAKGDQGVSLTAIIPHFILATSTPAKPTVASPSGWTVAEPGYRVNYNLYRSDKVIFSDNSFSWTAVTLVQSYQVAVQALESANGKNTINTSTANTPSKNGTTVGDIWWRVDSSNNVLAQWVWNGSSWKAQKIESEVIASLDVNKLTVSSSAKMQEAVINKIWADGIVAKTITTSRLAVSGGNIFPDPTFEDPYWDAGLPAGVNRNTNGISLQADGTQHGVYFQPEGKYDQAMQAEPGVKYRLTLHLRFGGNARISKMSIYARYKKPDNSNGVTFLGTFPRFPSDGQPHASYRYNDNSIELSIDSLDMAPGGYFTIGFFVENTETGGTVEIRNARLTRMAGATLIENGAVTTGKLDAGAVTADKIQAEQATIDKLWTSGIAAKSVTANRVLISNNGNMLPDISVYAQVSPRPNPDPYPWPIGLNADDPSVWIQGRTTATIMHPINLVAGQKYRFSYRARATVNGTRHYWQLRKGNAEGPTDGSVNAKVGSSTTSYPISNETINRGISSFESTFEALTTDTVFLLVYANHQNGADNPTGHQWFQDLRLEKLTGATLIEDGAITTDKINTLDITAQKFTMQSGFVKSAHIDSLDAGKISAGTININRIPSITTSKLANGAVSVDKLGNTTLEQGLGKWSQSIQVSPSMIRWKKGSATIGTVSADGLRFYSDTGVKVSQLVSGIVVYTGSGKTVNSQNIMLDGPDSVFAVGYPDTSPNPPLPNRTMFEVHNIGDGVLTLDGVDYGGIRSMGDIWIRLDDASGTVLQLFDHVNMLTDYMNRFVFKGTNPNRNYRMPQLDLMKVKVTWE